MTIESGRGGGANRRCSGDAAGCGGRRTSASQRGSAPHSVTANRKRVGCVRTCCDRGRRGISGRNGQTQSGISSRASERHGLGDVGSIIGDG